MAKRWVVEVAAPGLTGLGKTLFRYKKQGSFLGLLMLGASIIAL
jgi:hypothetical protein